LQKGYLSAVTRSPPSADVKLGLQEYYAQLSASEIGDRQEFAFEAAMRLRRRWFQPDVWERMDVDPRPVVRLMLESRPGPSRRSGP
jgi:hypothetical protein